MIRAKTLEIRAKSQPLFPRKYVYYNYMEDHGTYISKEIVYQEFIKIGFWIHVSDLLKMHCLIQRIMQIWVSSLIPWNNKLSFLQYSYKFHERLQYCRKNKDYEFFAAKITIFILINAQGKHLIILHKYIYKLEFVD